MIRTIGIIQARMTSTRLPGKVMEPVLGRPLLDLMIERLRRCETLDGIVVATTRNPADDPIVTLAQGLEVGTFRGSERDVLGRVLGAAYTFGADVIVELTADCPLIDPEIVDRVVRAYDPRATDLVSNAAWRYTYPRGMDARVFPRWVLADADARTRDPADREHVSLYVYERPGRYRLRYVAAPPELTDDVRLTVDTAEDLELVRAIFERLYPLYPAFSLAMILELLRREPELREINRHVEQKAVR